jgi:glutamate synthase domain-containing protein 1
MILLEETRLIEITVNKISNNMYIFLFNDNFFKFVITDLNNEENELALFLKRLKAKDDSNSPRSKRFLTYKELAKEIMDGSDNIIYIWSSFIKSIKKVCYIDDMWIE